MPIVRPLALHDVEDVGKDESDLYSGLEEEPLSIGIGTLADVMEAGHLDLITVHNKGGKDVSTKAAGWAALQGDKPVPASARNGGKSGGSVRQLQKHIVVTGQRPVHMEQHYHSSSSSSSASSLVLPRHFPCFSTGADVVRSFRFEDHAGGNVRLYERLQESPLTREVPLQLM